MSWKDDLQPSRAIYNLGLEKSGDWYRDPWGWPEYEFLRSPMGSDYLTSRLSASSHTTPPARIDVPKENFGLRPAVVLGISERIAYQTFVDALSPSLSHKLPSSVYGWRLPPDSKKGGRYARQDYQWRDYRSKISTMADYYEFGLKTDISSYFASLNPATVVARISQLQGQSRVKEELCKLLIGWGLQANIQGIPQRSTASAVIANTMLSKADDILAEAAYDVPSIVAGPKESSFARWMDDMWLFGDNEGELRSAQVALQSTLLDDGLFLNSGKTSLMCGDTLAEATKKIQSSAVDTALDLDPLDAEPLESLIDEVIEDGEMSDRSTVRFVCSRMRKHKISYRTEELLQIAPRLPHAADHLSRLFRQQVSSSKMQDWISDYTRGPWHLLEWPLAQFATTIPAHRKPRQKLRELFGKFIHEDGASLPLIAVSAQRLATWDPDQLIELVEDRASDEEDAHVTRVLSLAALQAGAEPRKVRQWLGRHDSNFVTLLMLDAQHFSPPPTSWDYR